MKHRANCKCPGCEGRATAREFGLWTGRVIDPPNTTYKRLSVGRTIRRLLRERATLYMVMADMTDLCRESEHWTTEMLRRGSAREVAARLVARERGRAK